MSRRWLSCVLISVFPTFGMGLSGCGTEAVGVDSCLQVERARCEAADACGLSERMACERYVEVQCLHGFVKSEQPSERAIKQCASELGQLAECVSTRGRKASTEVCKLDVSKASPERACELVEVPQELSACEFLTPPDAEDEDKADESDDESDEGDESDDDTSSSDTPASEDAGSKPDAG